MTSDNGLPELLCGEWSHPPRKHDRFWTYVNIILAVIGLIIITMLCFLLIRSYAHNDDFLRTYAERLEELKTIHQRKIDLRENALSRAKRDDTINRNSPSCLCPSAFHLEPKTEEHSDLASRPVQGDALGRGTSGAAVTTGAPQASGFLGTSGTTRAPWTTGGPEAPGTTWTTSDPVAPGSPRTTRSSNAHGASGARGAAGASGAPGAPGAPVVPESQGVIVPGCHEQKCWVCPNSRTA